MKIASPHFAKAFLLINDSFAPQPLSNKALARQAKEKFRIKNPNTPVVLYEHKRGEGLLYRGSKFYLLTNETADEFVRLKLAQNKRSAESKTQCNYGLAGIAHQAANRLKQAQKFAQALRALLHGAQKLKIRKKLGVSEALLVKGIDF